MLPAPAVSEVERDHLARLMAAGGGEAILLAESEAGGYDATRALLAEYAATPRASAPVRTPRVPTLDGRDFLLQEAQNLARLQQGATPLVGGPNPELHPSDFSGATPLRRTQVTPHPMAPVSTPARAPGDTPLRDGLGINLNASAVREGRSQIELMRAELRQGLAMLPPPRNEYQIVMPELEVEIVEAAMEEDAADVKEARRAAAAAPEAAARRPRSPAGHRGLPRPNSAPASLTVAGAISDAEALLRCEIALLIAHDASRYPMRPGLSSPGEAAPIMEMMDESLLAAGSLLRQEALLLRNELGLEQDSPEEHEAARAAVLPPVEQRTLFQFTRSEMERQARRAAKLDARAAVITSGYHRRSEELQVRLEKAVTAIFTRSAELAAFQCLHAQEVRAAPLRIEALASEVEEQLHRERELQERYRKAARSLGR
jgi:pre-mRNA-splicing factor CDC5/CEF1